MKPRRARKLRSIVQQTLIVCWFMHGLQGCLFIQMCTHVPLPCDQSEPSAEITDRPSDWVPYFSVLRLAERVLLYWGLLGVSDDIICHHPQQIPVPSPPGLIPECVSTSPLGSLRGSAYRNIGLNHGLLDQKDLDSSPASAFTYIQ